MAAVSPATAQPFERLSDGRVVIEIFGQKVALPTTKADLQRIEFYPEKAGERMYGTTVFKLGDALADPDKARRTFELEQRWVSIRIVTDWPADEKGPVLGRFSRGTIPLSNASSPLTIGIQRTPPLNLSKRGTLPENWPSEAATPDEDGYFVRPGIQGPNLDRPHLTGYRLPASQRLWRTNVDLIVVCRWIGRSTRICSQLQRTADDRISIGWSWYESSWRTPRGSLYENYFPKPQWKELDLRLHEVADYLLVNKPSGELE
jgi:hypothetical protein